jgi:hypothetical protein
LSPLRRGSEAEPFSAESHIRARAGSYINGLVVALGSLFDTMVNSARGRVADSGVENAERQLIEDGVVDDICSALRILHTQARIEGDSEELKTLKRTQKEYNCRRHRGD